MTDSPAFDDEQHRDAADAVHEALLARTGEGSPKPRLEPTRRAMELLADVHRSYPAIHVTGTNGKSSTSRMIESLLRAHGLRTGLLTSPHLDRLNERIVIDGEPISNRALAANWADVEPYLALVDDELRASGDSPLSYFEALTVLGFACLADAPVDVAVVEVGMGGEWDSTNVIDGQVAVFTPIALDHVERLGSTLDEIAHTKSGIIKPAARVVSAAQVDDVRAVLERAAQLSEAPLSIEGEHFAVASSSVAVGGQLVEVRGIAASYSAQFLPLFGDHQAQNAAVAVAAVESFLGDGTLPINDDVLAEGFGTATSPGRLELVGIDPTVLVDAAHNPHGAAALARAIRSYFDFAELAVVTAVLEDKDATGIVDQLAAIADRLLVTTSSSDRALEPDALADLAQSVVDVPVERFGSLADAAAEAREWAAQRPDRAVVITGSITLVADAMRLAAIEGWKP